MAKNDMRIDVDFVDHIKVKRLIRKLGYEGFYSLVRLFSTAAKMYQKGELKGCDEFDIEDLSMWNGVPGMFVETLLGIDIQFLENREGTFIIHDWKDNQPWIYHSVERSKKASKASRIRWEENSGLSKNQISSSNASSNAPSPSPFPTPTPIPVPYQIPKYDSDVFTVEEGKNEEQRKREFDDTDDPIVVNLPLNSGLSFPVHESFVKELTPLYPAVDIKAQLLQMAGWLIGNPSKRKTQKGILRFITNWLSTQQDKVLANSMNTSLDRGLNSRKKIYGTETGSLKTNPNDYNHL
jgi:hypothetical protein